MGPRKHRACGKPLTTVYQHCVIDYLRHDWREARGFVIAAEFGGTVLEQFLVCGHCNQRLSPSEVAWFKKHLTGEQETEAE
jgi:hypothetical protein